MVVKVISFDADGCLVKPTFSDRLWCEHIPRHYAKAKGLPLRLAKQYVIGEYATVSPERLEWYDLGYWLQRFALAKKLSAETLIEETKKYIALYAEVPAVLETLYGARCYKLIVTSNAHRVFLRAMLSSISYYFAETISAPEDFGMVKCSEKFYGALLAHLGVRAEELVHVGDHRLHDCLIPRRLGILAYHLDRSLSKDDAREQFSIQSLRALLTHLRE